MNSEIFGFLAVAALSFSYAIGHKSLRKEPELKVTIGILLFVSVGALTTSFIRQPLFVWPLGFGMLGAMLYLVRTMYARLRRNGL